MTLFDILNSISDTKKDMSNEDDFDKVYNVFMINRFLSMHNDTVFFAYYGDRLINNIGKKQHYKFLLASIPKKKRYFKYEKKEKTQDDVKLIMTYFNINENEAIQYSKFLTHDDIHQIKLMYKGE